MAVAAAAAALTANLNIKRIQEEFKPAWSQLRKG